MSVITLYVGAAITVWLCWFWFVLLPLFLDRAERFDFGREV